MIKLTNTALIALISASLLVGCGGSGSDDDSKGSTDGKGSRDGVRVEVNDDTQPVEPNNGTGRDTPATPPPPATTSAKAFTADVMPVLDVNCKSCHGTSGDFTVTTASATWDNIQQFGAQVVHDYGNGGMGHPVGDKLSDADSATFQAWINAGAMNN